MSPAPAPASLWLARLAAVTTELTNFRADASGEKWNVTHVPGVGPAGLLALADRADAIREEIDGLKSDRPRPSVRGVAGALDRARRLVPGGADSPLRLAARADTPEAVRAAVVDAAMGAHDALTALTALREKVSRVPPADPPPPPPSPPAPAHRAVVVVELAGLRRLVAAYVTAMGCHDDPEQRAYVVNFYQDRLDHFVWEATRVLAAGPQYVFATLGPVRCLVFGTAEEGYQFVRAVAEQAVVHNRREGSDGLNVFHFRFALGWGRLWRRTPVAAPIHPDHPYSVAVGEPVLAAHHLCPLGQTGELLVQTAAFDELVRTGSMTAFGLGAAVMFRGAAGDPDCEAYRCPVP